MIPTGWDLESGYFASWRFVLFFFFFFVWELYGRFC